MNTYGQLLEHVHIMCQSISAQGESLLMSQCAHGRQGAFIQHSRHHSRLLPCNGCLSARLK